LDLLGLLGNSLKAGLMKLGLLHRFAFATKKNDRNPITAKLAILTIIRMLIPSRIIFRYAYGLPAN